MTLKDKIIVIVGPTSVGKTALGITLAQIFKGEIISGDSQQVYKGLDIGTAKATIEEQAAAKHHLIDIRHVTETYSAYDFVQDATQAIEEISSKGKLPIIVGGTGLYLQSLLEGYHLGGNLDQEALLQYRKELEDLSDAQLFQKIEEEGIQIDQINRRRAVRALELHTFGSDLENSEFPYEFMLIGLNDDRQVIYDRINKRVDHMVETGLLEEANDLFLNYPEVQASRGIGYKELFPYFRGEESLERGIESLKQSSRRFAKRQLTWFRNRMSVPFYAISDPEFPANIIEDVRQFLEEK